MKLILVVLALLIAVALYVFTWPIPGLRPLARARALGGPDSGYATAVASILGEAARNPQEMAPECRSILLEHGHRTGRVVLFFHGITNCPMQFMQIGQRLYESGANVYIPRIPHHGLADRMTTDLANLEAQEMADFADHELDLATSLGDTVVVSGLSLGGVLSAYLAQEREEVALAVPIAPLLGPAMAPAWAARPLTRVALAAPNGFMWWDDKRRENLPGPKRVYPRFATRAMAEIMRLGAIVEDRAADHAPAARRIVMVTVGKDPAVSNAAIAHLVRAWRSHAPDRVQAYEFPDSMRLGHDVIDPDQPYQRVGVVYPILESILQGGSPR
jgi:esterase/lipase